MLAIQGLWQVHQVWGLMSQSSQDGCSVEGAELLSSLPNLVTRKISAGGQCKL